MQNISVVTPSFNERDNIVEFIERISAALKNSLLEIIIVDDNSPDRTWEVVQNLNNPKCKLIRRTNAKGLASALKEGIGASTGDVVLWLDCDLGIPPEESLNLIKYIGEYDVVIGSRYARGGIDLRPKWRALLSALLNRIASMWLDGRIHDYTSGFACAKKEVFGYVPINGVGFGQYFIEWAYKCARLNFKILEVGYKYSLREKGVSKTDGNLLVFIKLGISYFITILRVKFIKPEQRPYATKIS
jgi:dolichol-phosphate mannosyltransferase